MKSNGLKLLGIAAVLAVIGAILIIVLEGGSESGIGVAIVALACVPGLAGIALVGSSIVSKRSREDKPWA